MTDTIALRLLVEVALAVRRIQGTNPHDFIGQSVTQFDSVLKEAQEALQRPEANSVRAGDTMRISVPLLREIYDEPEHTSPNVRVKEVIEEPDGSKTLFMERL